MGRFFRLFLLCSDQSGSSGFNPLGSGALLQTAGAGGPGPGHTVSIPSEVGRFFRREREIARQEERICVSIPSEVGRFFRRRSCWLTTYSIVPCSFNPLGSGALLQTRRAGPPRSRQGEGFNPLGSGALLQTPTGATREFRLAFRTKFQSPRKWGASSDNDLTPDLPSLRQGFNPLGSGALLQTAGQIPVQPAHDVSIPSEVGRFFRRKRSCFGV